MLLGSGILTATMSSTSNISGIPASLYSKIKTEMLFTCTYIYIYILPKKHRVAFYESYWVDKHVWYVMDYSTTQACLGLSLGRHRAARHTQC